MATPATKTPSPSRGHRLFTAFLETTRTTDTAAAVLFGVSKVTVGNWRKGSSTPEAVYRAAIARWTSGQIPAESWTTKNERRILESIKPRGNALPAQLALASTQPSHSLAQA